MNEQNGLRAHRMFLNTHQCEKARPAEDFRLNKIVTQEELTMRLTLYHQSSDSLYDLAAHYLHDRHSGQPRLYTQQENRLEAQRG